MRVKNKIAGEVKAVFIKWNGISDAKSYLKMYDNQKTAVKIHFFLHFMST